MVVLQPNKVPNKRAAPRKKVFKITTSAILIVITSAIALSLCHCVVNGSEEASTVPSKGTFKQQLKKDYKQSAKKWSTPKPPPLPAKDELLLPLTTAGLTREEGGDGTTALPGVISESAFPGKHTQQQAHRGKGELVGCTYTHTRARM